ncbi:MAG: hypothetical protein EOP11_11450, partial [Proteobacteria bacterium]
MGQVVRLEVRDLDCNPRDQRYARNARTHLRIPVFGTETVQLFWLKAQDGAFLPDPEVRTWAERVFSDPVLQEYAFSHTPEFRLSSAGSIKPSFVAQVRFLPGVTDNVGHTATEALSLLGGFAATHGVRAFTGKAVYFYGDLSRGEVEKVALETIGNALIEEILVLSWDEYYQAARFERQRVPEVQLVAAPEVEMVNIEEEDKILERMSRDRCWALTLAEMKTVQAHFAKPEVRAQRAQFGLPTAPTDVEMEIIAQSWSEHCK